MKKKILALALVVVLAVTAVTGATLAYFTDTKEATNIFTVGNVQIELTEPKWEGKVEKVYPGQVLDKDPTVKNTGANPCYVRVKVEGLDCLGGGLKIALKTGDEVISSDWTLHTDGYYYYEKVLEAGKTTDALFDQIVIPTALTNKNGTEHTKEYNIKVTAYAVQSEGSGLAADAAVADIANWFKTCGMNAAK